VGNETQTQGFNWRTLTPEIQAAVQALETLATGQKPLSQLTGSLTELKVVLIEALSSLRLNPFTFWNAFINAWRQSFPILAPIGNYTLLQVALVLAIGGLAAGNLYNRHFFNLYLKQDGVGQAFWNLMVVIFFLL